MTDVDSVVIGAGVVGLAVARALATTGREVLVLEALDDIGLGTSSRSSEVIHAGIYYPAGSLKAQLCVAGRSALYRYCVEHGVPHHRIGKMIVATDEDQVQQLAGIAARAAANGVDDLQLLSKRHATELEPAVQAEGALLSPSTGIVDSAALMRSYRRDVVDAGGDVALRSPVRAVRAGTYGLVVEVAGDTGGALRAREVINAAGLGAWSVAANPPPPRFLAKGNYFRLERGRAPFTRLIYPVPVDGGLGIHLTLDLDGAARFGPDVQWLDPADSGSDYSVDPARAQTFYEGIRQYWPDLPDDALAPDYSGIRPKVTGPGQPAGDFTIIGPAESGTPGLVELFGIESPGLTSSLAIADRVVEMLKV
ncbi:NAD(P)/FAD-dependent oxidoreductase [Williamsia sp. CHRR-6]|uniref:NAD(P)/FAD-dependent oxidoreductase n=1 Tax=Williamsia sp. CHRR-6 TaxID=2835871 RepID=UPI001BD9BE12|nr:NAD(P)/FAD-dependent oxidoreductase [Williamsia sp. CHRR-6]MBT0567225.1 NAD(P)/FAD-dependent oxidoreductase [Williamsia sp. CHRR-6]